VRLFAAIVAAAILYVPATGPARAHHGEPVAHLQDFASAKKAKKKIKRPQVKKEEYMRAAPSR
jgi:hypothetical protein